MKPELIDVRAGCEVRVYQGGQGPELVYLHGVTGLLEEDPFLCALSEKFTVFAPVLPGFEDSGGEDLLTDMQSFALHTFDVIDRLGLVKPILAGHCLGGMIAGEMAAIANNDIEKLILIGAMGLWDDEAPVPDLFTTLPFELPALMFDDTQLGERLLTAGFDFNDAEFLTGYLVANAKRMGTAGRLLFPIPDRGLAHRLYRIKADTRIIWGENDKLLPLSYGKSLESQIKNATLNTVADAGHMVNYEATREVIQIIESGICD